MRKEISLSGSPLNFFNIINSVPNGGIVPVTTGRSGAGDVEEVEGGRRERMLIHIWVYLIAFDALSGSAVLDQDTNHAKISEMIEGGLNLP